MALKVPGSILLGTLMVGVGVGPRAPDDIVNN